MRSERDGSWQGGQNGEAEIMPSHESFSGIQHIDQCVMAQACGGTCESLPQAGRTLLMAGGPSVAEYPSAVQWQEAWVPSRCLIPEKEPSCDVSSMRRQTS